jgi:hypothetical protein
MTEKELDALEAAARKTREAVGCEERLQAECDYIAASRPRRILDLISQIRACHELIEVLTEAVIMTESVAFTRSYFNHSAYADVCRNIPELRQKAGLPPIGGKDD